MGASVEEVLEEVELEAAGKAQVRMKKYAKWIGGGMGWVLGGPIGALLGFAIGSMIDNTTQVSTYGPGGSERMRTTTNDFIISLLILSAVVMKADGKVMKSELNYVKAFFTRQFGNEKASELMLMLRDLLSQPIDVRGVGTQIRQHMAHPMRLQLLHYLFGIAAADGSVATRELEVIEEISRNLGISLKDFESIRAMFGTDEKSAYKVLEIEESASDTEVKKAYRKMALKYHPDKVGDLGEEVSKAAREKFEKVQQAYDAIKKQRGFK